MPPRNDMEEILIQPVSLPSAIVQQGFQTIANDPLLSLGALFFLVVGVLVFVQWARGQPRFDPTRHIERLPNEEHPRRSLPPASDYATWEQKQDAEKDGVPWR